jgi:two-component system OmpR family sensor kinase
MKRYLPFLIASPTLAIIGFLLAGVAKAGSIPNPLLSVTLQFDFAGLVSRAGLALGLIVLTAGGLKCIIERSTHKARVHEKSEQKEANKGFIRRLDHELKNPLTIIRLGTVNLTHSSNLTSKESATLHRVGIQTEKLQKLIEDLRWLAELDATGLEWSQVSLEEVLQEAVALATSLPGRDQQSIHLSLQRAPWPPGSILGDREVLILAFRNLLDNALKFSSPGENIEIRATDDGNRAIIEVADRGPGIPPDELPHIFEELFRGRQTKQIEGSGLGLALVRRIIELHGGDIQVRSQVSVGTVMIVHLPLTSSGGQRPAQ